MSFICHLLVQSRYATYLLVPSLIMLLIGTKSEIMSNRESSLEQISKMQEINGKNEITIITATRSIIIIIIK